MVRHSATLFLLGVVALASGQADEKIDPRSVPPDVFITVRKGKSGEDLVDVRMRVQGYPLEELRRQCLAVGTETGSDVKGLEVYNIALGGPQGNTAASAAFGCNHLVDRDLGEMDLGAIVRAFVGAPKEWRVQSFLVVFADEKPTNKTIRSLRKGNVRLEAADFKGQPGIEYRVLTLTQDPKEINVPRNMAHKEAVPSSSAPPSKNLHPAVVPLLAIGAIGAGVLVYLGLRKEKSTTR
ncbi:MAG: hypothetical protein JSS65_03245 [Armatimonadetes bacterium]|nr:hypothetical protein [Armatimonadota bacterium]